MQRRSTNKWKLRILKKKKMQQQRYYAYVYQGSPDDRQALYLEGRSITTRVCLKSRYVARQVVIQEYYVPLFGNVYREELFIHERTHFMWFTDQKYTQNIENRTTILISFAIHPALYITYMALQFATWPYLSILLPVLLPILPPT